MSHSKRNRGVFVASCEKARLVDAGSLAARLRGYPRVNQWLGYLLVLVLCVAHLPQSASAATFTWSGSGGTSLWSNATNWGGSAPTNSTASALVFDGTLQLSSTNDFSSYSFGSVTFGNTTTPVSSAFTLSGNQFTLASQVRNNTTGLATISTDLIITDTRSFYTYGAGMLITGSISGAGGLTKDWLVGSGAYGTYLNTLSLTGSNTYTGATTVGSGTVVVSGTLGTINQSASVVIGYNGTSELAGTRAATLRLDNTAGNVDRIGDAKTVTLYNQGELQLVGNATSSTTETIANLTLGLGTYNSGGVVTLSGSGASTLTTLSAGAFTRFDKSTMLVRGTNLGQAATGATRILLSSTAGLTFVGNSTASGTTPGTATDVRVVPYLLGDTSTTGNGSGFVTYDTVSGLRPLGSTEYKLLSSSYTSPTNSENARAFNGTMTVAAPTVNSLLFDLTSATLNGSGTLTVKSGAVAAVANSVALGSRFNGLMLGSGTWTEGILTASSGNTLTINAPITINGGTSGTLTKAGKGTLVLAAPSFYDGVTYVNEGVLSVFHDKALGTGVGNTVVNAQSGAVLQVQNNVNIPDAILLNGAAVNYAASLSIPTGQNTLSGLLTFGAQSRTITSAGASMIFKGGVTGTNIQYVVGASGTNIYKTTAVTLGTGGYFYMDYAGLAILAVSGNTFNTLLAGGGTGTVRLDVVNAVQSTTLLNIGVSYSTNAGGILDLNGNNQTAAGIQNAKGATVGLPTARLVTSANAATLTLSTSTNYSFDGTFRGALGVTKNGSNTQTFSGSSTHVGDTTVNTGVLALGTLTALQNSTLDTGSVGTQSVTFTFSGTNTYTLGGLKGADDLAIGANSLRIGANNQSTSYTGAITGTTGGLAKIGTGALTLGGTNTFTGPTSIGSGSLILDYTATNSSKLADAGSLTLDSAVLQLDRATGATGTHTEVVASTSLIGGATINRGSGSSATLRMMAITRSAGATLNLGAAGIATTDTTNTNGILGGWATIAGTDWAMNLTNAGSGSVSAYAGYTTVNSLGGTIANTATSNVSLVNGGVSGNVTLGNTGGVTNVFSLKMDSGASASTIAPAAGETLRLGAVGGILVATGANSLTIGSVVNQGTLTAGGTANTSGEIVMQQFSTNTLTINSAILDNGTGSVSLTQSGVGTTVLAGTNTYTGRTVINGGSVSVSAESALGANPSSFTADQLKLNGGTLRTTASFSLSGSNRGITLGAAGGTFEVNTGTLTVASTNIIAGSGGLTKAGVGTLLLSGTANTYTGPTTISGGILSVSQMASGGTGGTASSLGASNNGNFNLVFDGGTLKYTGATSATDRFFTINTGKTATIEVTNSTGSLTLGGGAAATNGSLTKTGSGMLTLSGASDYTGGTNVSAGTLVIGANNSLGRPGGGTTVALGAQLRLQNSITVADALSLAGYGDASSTGALYATNGANIITGSITANTVSGNEVKILAATASLTLSGGLSYASASASNQLSLSSNSANGFLSVDTNPFNVQLGTIAVYDAGSVRLGVAGNQYALLFVAYTGTLRTDIANALDSSGILQIGITGTGSASAYQGTVDLNGNSQTVAQLKTGAGSINQAGTRTIGSVAAATLTVNQSANTTYDGALTGALGLTKGGSGTLTLTGTGSNTGTTTLTGGTLSLAGTYSLVGGGSVTFGGGTLQFSSVNTTDLSSQIFNSTGAIAVDTNGQNIVFAGTLASSNTGGFAKVGSGELTLSGSNLFSGNTTITTGTLTVSKATGLGTAGAVTLASGAALNYAASTDAPLTINGNLTAAGGGTTILGGAIGAGATSAQISVSGTALLGSGTYALNVYGIAGVNPLSGTNVYTLLHGGSLGSSGATFTLGNVYASSNFFTVGGISNTANELQIQITGTAALTNAYWRGGYTGATNVWGISNGSDNSNWTASLGGGTQSLTPGTTTIAVFSNSTIATVPTATVLGSNMSIGGILISDSQGMGLVADSKILTLGTSGITMSSGAGAGSIAASVVLGGAQTWANSSSNALTISGNIDNGGNLLSVGGTGSVTISGILSNTGGLTMVGTGSLTLTGSQTYTGVTTISAGTIRIGNGTTNGLLQAAPGIVNNSDLWFDVAGTQTYGGVISGTGAVTKRTSVSTLILDGDSTYTGATNVIAGTLYVASASALGGTSTGTTVSSGAMVKIGGGITVAEGFSLTGSGDATAIGALVSVSGANVVTGAITAGSGQTKIGANGGSLSLTGAVTRAGAVTSDILVALSNSASEHLFFAGTVDMGVGGLEIVNSGVVHLAAAGNSYGYLNAGWSGTARLDIASALASSGTLEIGYYTGSTTSSFIGSVDLNGFSQTIGELRTGSASLYKTGTRTIGSTTAATLTVNQATNSTYDGTITGLMALTKSGSGTLTLAGSNRSAGAVTLSAGTIAAGTVNTNVLGGSAAYTLANVSGARLNLNGFNNTIGSLAGGGTLGGDVSLGSGTLTTGADGTSTVYAGTISGSGGLTKTGSGTMTLSGSNSFTGLTTMGSGTLNLGSTTALAGAGSLTFSGGTLQFGTSGATYTNAITGSGTSGVLLDSNTNSGTLSGNIYANNTGGLTKRGAGVVMLSGSNGFTGVTTISAGTLSLGSANALAGGGSLTFSGGTLQFGTSGATYTNAITGSGASVILLDSNTNGGTLSGNIYANNTGGLTKMGVGAVALSGSNGFTGVTAIAAGTLALGSANALAGGGSLTFGGGTLQFSASNTTDYATRISNSTSGAIAIDTNGQGVTFSGALQASNTGGLTKLGAGTLTLSGSNGFSGVTTIAAGTLSLGSANALAGGGSVTFGGGTLQFGTSGVTYTNAITGSGSSVVLLDSAANSGTLSGDIYASNTGGLTKVGVGVVTLSGSNGFTGVTTISAGTLSLGSANALAGGGSVTFGGGTLQFGTSGVTYTNAITGSGSSVILLDSNTNGGTLSGNIYANNTGGLTKLGVGTVTLSGSNSYTGVTTISAGTLSLGSANALAGGGSVTFGGGTLQFGTSGVIYTNAITGSGSSVISLDSNTNGGTLSGNIYANNIKYPKKAAQLMLCIPYGETTNKT